MTLGFSGNIPQFKGAAKSQVTQTGGVRRLESVRSVSGQAPSVLQKTVEKAQDETKRVSSFPPIEVQPAFLCLLGDDEVRRATPPALIFHFLNALSPRDRAMKLFGA